MHCLMESTVLWKTYRKQVDGNYIFSMSNNYTFFFQMGQSSFFLFLMINDTSPFYQIVTQQVPSIKNSRENGSKANLNRNKEFYYMILELEKI